MKRILITGGAGFIGSHFYHLIKRREMHDYLIIDKLTYAGDMRRLGKNFDKRRFVKADIYDRKKMEYIMHEFNPDVVVHFAAESHVDNSIVSSKPFIDTNVIGTESLLCACRNVRLDHFLYVSTDEIYGSHEVGNFAESDPYNPGNPYSATKAAAEHLVKAYGNTFGIPYKIVRPANNFGPWQDPEKFIPKVISQAWRNKKFPLYGKGSQIREWIYVEDCVNGIFYVMRNGKKGEAYNIGSGFETNNFTIANIILRKLKKRNSLIKYVKDRPGHDYRYGIDSSKANGLGWKCKVEFEDAIDQTIQWYKNKIKGDK